MAGPKPSSPATQPLPLFPDLPEQLAPADIKQAATGPVWTEQKAQLIARYLRYFVFITKHGAYIDGFAAPKDEGRPETWAARLVLETEPRWLRQFYLCDLEDRASHLHTLAAGQPQVPNRTVEVFAGDFNGRVRDVLRSPQISGKTATFCLLDQYTMECDWETVRVLAQHKGPGFRKIELFYFLAAGWVHRTLKAFADDRRPRAWWGRPDWEALKGSGQTKLALAFTDRFENELGYRYVQAWPIYERERGGGRIMFYMIHASDHPEAPSLMGRAYRNVVQPLEPGEQLALELGRMAED